MPLRSLAATFCFALIPFAACGGPRDGQSRSAAQPANTPGLILRNVTLLDGLDTIPKRNVAITIRAGRIESVRLDAEQPFTGATAGDSILDLHDAWVVPGLIDAHAHVGFDHQASVDDNILAAQRALAGGVTTLRSMGVPRWADVQLRERFRTGAARLPRILTSGNGLVSVVSDSWLDDFLAVQPFLKPTTPADSALMISPGRRWRLAGEAAIDTTVGVLKGHGADWVKVLATGRSFGSGSPLTPLFSEDELQAMVRAARRRGLLVAAHAHGDEGMRSAVLAGVRTIEHGTYASDATLRLMQERGICFVPTLTWWDEQAEMPDSLARVQAARMRAAAEDAVRRARSLGVAVIAGTDNIYMPSTRGIVDELLALANAGVPPTEVLLAATSRAAACLEVDDRLGAVAPEREADLLVLEGDPRGDLRRLGAPRLVLVAGRVVFARQ